MFDTFVYDRNTYDISSKEARKLKLIDTRTLLNSDFLFFLNMAEARYYTEISGISLNKLNYAILPVLRDYNRVAKISYFRGKKNFMQICWTGSYIPLHGLDVILEAFIILKREKVNCKLLIWGDDDIKSTEYKEFIKNNDLNDYCTIRNEWGNIDLWADYMKENCDVFLGIFGNSRKAKTVLANKVVDGVNFRIPTITGNSSGVNEYFNSDSLFITDNTPEALASTIIKLYSMTYDEIKKNTDKAYNIYCQNLSRDHFSHTINEAISKL